MKKSNKYVADTEKKLYAERFLPQVFCEDRLQAFFERELLFT